MFEIICGAVLSLIITELYHCIKKKRTKITDKFEYNAYGIELTLRDGYKPNRFKSLWF